MRQAIQFLTVLPLNAPLAPLGRGAWAFPIVGAILGLIAAPLWSVPFGPLLILIALALSTGGLHDDGLADIFDALRAYRTREKMLQIMKDSRIGAHGTLALIASFVFRWQALNLLHGNAWMRLPAALGISRAMIVLLAATAPSVSEGSGRAFANSLPNGAVAVAALEIGLLSVLAGWPAAAALVAGNLLMLLVVRWWFIARLGGVTGDCYGAVCIASEAVSFGVLAWV